MTAIKTILRSEAPKTASQPQDAKPAKQASGTKGVTSFDKTPARAEVNELEAAFKKNKVEAADVQKLAKNADTADIKIAKEKLEDILGKNKKEDPTDIFPDPKKVAPETGPLAKETVEAYDHDGDGAIDLKTEKWRVEPVGKDDAEIVHLTKGGSKLLRAADAIGNKDGKVTEEELKAALDKFDLDDDGKLTGDEKDTFKPYDPLAEEEVIVKPRPKPPIWDGPGLPDFPERPGRPDFPKPVPLPWPRDPDYRYYSQVLPATTLENKAI